jgi:hypothetical protein
MRRMSSRARRNRRLRCVRAVWWSPSNWLRRRLPHRPSRRDVCVCHVYKQNNSYTNPLAINISIYNSCQHIECAEAAALPVISAARHLLRTNRPDKALVLPTETVV